MKVLMINSVCGIGSTGRICTDLANELTKKGHDVKIAYGREQASNKFSDYAVKIGGRFSVKLNALKARLFDNEGFNAKRATKKFLKWAEEFNPDVLHLHNLHGYYLNVELLFKWIKSRPNMKVLWTLHDCWAFTGHCSYFDYANCDKWQIECCNCPQKRKYPKSIFKSNAKNNFIKKKMAFCGIENLQIITPSKWLKGLVKNSFLKEYEVKVVYNGIDVNVFKPTISEFKKVNNLEHKKIILGVANVWEERKGFSEFIELSKLIDGDTRIVLVGVSDKQLNVLPNNVLGIKRTNSVDELVEIYSASDVLFNPTYEDNYPTVNLEAQACGTPVITYKTGGSVESVPNENVIEKGNYKEVLEKLNKKLKIKESDFSKNSMIEGYLKLIN